MLGIMPYVSAYILVELLSLCIPLLKKLRSGDYKGRLKLKRIALIVSMFLSIYQANALITNLKNWNLSGGKAILNISDTFEHVLLVCLLVGCFYLLLFLCELISKFGIGHGISIIIFSGICGDYIHQVPRHFKQFEYYRNYPSFWTKLNHLGL